MEFLKYLADMFDVSPKVPRLAKIKAQETLKRYRTVSQAESIHSYFLNIGSYMRVACKEFEDKYNVKQTS